MKIKNLKKKFPYLILIFFGVLMLFLGIVNHYLFKTATYDYANYNFAFWDYSHFRISQLTTFRGNFLQDHFSFTLFYFVPVYWLLNWLTGSYTLIVIQCSLILISAWYTYLTIRLKSDNYWLSVGVLVFYFLLLGRYTSFASDVNLAIMSACFIPIFIYYFELRKYIIAAIILVLSLFSRENIPLWFIFIFIVLIIQHWKDKKAVRFSLLGIVVSVIYFVLLFKVFIPAIENPDTKYALFNYSALGENPGEALSFILRHPFESIKMFFTNHLDDPTYDGVKMEFYLVYLISGGFLLFIRPQYLIWFIPIIAQKVLNDAPFRWGLTSYYSIEIVTLLPLSVFLALSALKNKKLQNALAITACIGAISMTINKLDQGNCRVPWFMNPAKEKFYDKRFYKPPFDVKKVNRLLSLIPPDAKVSGSNMLVPHIAQRKNIYFFPNVNDAEYIVFSVLDNNYLLSQKDNEASRLEYLSNPKWELVSLEYPVVLLKYNGLSTSEGGVWNKLLAEDSDTLFCNYEQIDTINNQVFFSNGEVAEKGVRLSQERSHSDRNSLIILPKDHSSSFKIKDITSIGYLQLNVWCFSDKDEGNITVTCGNGFSKVSYETDSIESSGWRRLVLNFWMPQNLDSTNFQISLGNNASKPVFFDDFQVVKNYKMKQ